MILFVRSSQSELLMIDIFCTYDQIFLFDNYYLIIILICMHKLGISFNKII